MLEFPLPDTFFPQVVLSADDVAYYKRLGKDRLAMLVRIAEDADCAYVWRDARTRLGLHVQRAEFQDVRQTSKAAVTSTLLKASVVLRDVKPEEVLYAIAKVKTKEYRKSLRYLHGPTFVDARTLFKFPSSVAANRPDYSYRAIKWCAFKSNPHERDNRQVSIDFSVLEYAGKTKRVPGSMVVGFCLQESIARDREVPALDTFGIIRGYLSRCGIIISRTHDPRALRVTSICQIDGDVEPKLRRVLDDVVQEYVGAIERMQGLIDRRRVASLQFMQPWEWVAKSDRKACAVCLRNFFFHRKHHCHACGEVVCSSCAPQRELDERIADSAELRVCSSCMLKAGDSIKVPSNEVLTSQDSEDALSTTLGDDHDDRRNPERSGVSTEAPKDVEEFKERETKDLQRQPSNTTNRILSNRKRELSTPQHAFAKKRQQETAETLVNLVKDIQSIREAVNLSISEAGGSDMSFGDDDTYQELYDSVNNLKQSVQDEDLSADEALSLPDENISPLPRENSGDLAQPPAALDEQIASVAKMTFEAARAAKAASELYMSSCASDDEEGRDRADTGDDDFPTSSDSENPYASANYERMMAPYRHQYESLETMLQEPAQPLQTTPKPNDRKMSNRVRLLERKIAALQRDLEHAHNKLSFLVDEPEPEQDALGAFSPQDFDDDDLFQGNRRRRTAPFASQSVPERSQPVGRVERVWIQSPGEKLRTSAPTQKAGEDAEASRRSMGFLRRASPPSTSTSPKMPLSSARPPPPPVPTAKIMYLDDHGREIALDNSRKEAAPGEKTTSSSGSRPRGRQELKKEPSPPSSGSRLPLSRDDDDFARLPRYSESAVRRSGRDESAELRELMQGLIGQRHSLSAIDDEISSSSSFQGHAMPTPTRTRTPTPRQMQQMQCRSGAAEPHALDSLVSKFSHCLVRLRRECLSDGECARKLQMLRKILTSLHRDGVRSTKRTLSHDQIHYEKMLSETPSFIQLLRLAGYVSSRGLLTMRQVDADRIARFLRTTENEMQQHSTSRSSGRHQYL